MMTILENFEFSIFQTASNLEAAQTVSYRIGIFATRAWEQDLLAAGQLSELLGFHRIPLRTIFYENQSEEGKSDDILKFPVR